MKLKTWIGVIIFLIICVGLPLILINYKEYQAELCKDKPRECPWGSSQEKECKLDCWDMGHEYLKLEYLGWGRVDCYCDNNGESIKIY